jgi:hypothetical protein
MICLIALQKRKFINKLLKIENIPEIVCTSQDLFISLQSKYQIDCTIIKHIIIIMDESKTPLELFLDKIKHRMTMQKIMSTPRTFEDLRMGYTTEMAEAYYVIKLCDDWVDEIPVRINLWMNVIDEYFGEFHGQWKYYAIAKRLDSIKEYGPDERDLDEDGEIRKDNLSNDDLKYHTVFNDLYFYESRDILQDFIMEDIAHIQRAVMFDTVVDFKRMFRDLTGKDVDSYNIDSETGELRKSEFGEYELHKAADSVDAEDESDVLYMLACIINDMMCKLRKKEEDMFDNHTEFLQQMREDCVNIINMQLQKTSNWKELKEQAR